MAEQIRKETSRQHSNEEVIIELPGRTNEENNSTEKMKADLDNLLDEIDLVLETNAEEFVKGYIQKGGE